MITKAQLQEIQIGQRIGSVTAPWFFPSPGLCEREGRVIDKISGKWGNYLMVELDDGEVTTAYSCYDANKREGIGWYALEG